jgi:hypothetical protein
MNIAWLQSSIDLQPSARQFTMLHNTASSCELQQLPQAQDLLALRIVMVAAQQL